MSPLPRNRFPQRCVDPCLPVWAVGLEGYEPVRVFEGEQKLGARRGVGRVGDWTQSARVNGYGVDVNPPYRRAPARIRTELTSELRESSPMAFILDFTD